MDTQDFTMYIDSHQILEFEVEDIETIEGADVKWKLAKTRDSTPLIIKTAVPVTGNTFTVTVEPEDNQDLTQGTYYHEARVEYEGYSRPVAMGIVSVVNTLTSA